MSKTLKIKDYQKPYLEAPDKEKSEVDPEEIDVHTRTSNEDEECYRKSRGVILIESVKDLMNEEGNGSKVIRILVISVLVLAWSISLDSSTTTNYEVYATSSYGHHTLISTLRIAARIISAIGQLFFAKFSDVTSRPITYLVALLLYVIGYIIIPSGSSISSFIVGNVFGHLGNTVLSITSTFIVGDLTPLKWRCFGLALLSSPSIINTWFSGLIVEDILAKNWRWGYGMFAIIVPVSLIPAMASLFYYQRKASKRGIVQQKAKTYGIQVKNSSGRWIHIYIGALKEIDIIGLALLATSLSLLLLPLSLYRTAKDQWKNPSIIAMFIVGGVLLMGFILFEIYLAPVPCMHKRNFNRTVITEIIFNVFYFMSSSLRETYLSSFVWIYKNWSNRDWTYFNNSIIVTKCLFGLIAGLIHRRTRRYKYLQISGICIEIIGAGLWVSVRDSNSNTAKLVMAQILAGLGGGLSVYSSRTAIQAAVTHQNMTVAIAMLLLFSSIGSAIGSAIAAAIWNGKMPDNLRKYMPDNVSDKEVYTYFSDLTVIRKFALSNPVRTAAIDAYVDTMHYHFAIALGILFISFLVCFAQKNYYLGDGQNAVDPDEKDYTEEHDNTLDLVHRFKARFTKK